MPPVGDSYNCINLLQILCDPFADDFYWKNVNVDGLTPQLLKEAIVGGTDGKHPFYIGKKYHEFRWKIGRIALPDTGPLKGLILLTDNGELYMATNFDILMYNYDEWGSNSIILFYGSILLCSVSAGNITNILLICYYCVLMQLFRVGNQHNYFWRDYKGTIPDDAFEFEGLVVAQIPYNGLLPATLYPKSNEAVSECFGRKVSTKTDIKVLCDNYHENFSWEYVNVNNLTTEKLSDYVIGGTEGGSTLYIGKVFHEGQWKIGKVFPPSSQWKGLRVWYNNGDLYRIEDFQILKYSPHLVNQFDVRNA
ncbi:hypothetical protein MML48_9g00012273 [Holotrichia oblita]|uniref:Uncharacterized protein n=1 Tax=Holotrichia oblita TaxID=644536 RepID=A0ACB9SKL0_HOLOL|nr:hypothetical protein MML48_9g00012273 [Holotrichia oblita]